MSLVVAAQQFLYIDALIIIITTVIDIIFHFSIYKIRFLYERRDLQKN